jgi:hypothetical protein
VGASSILGIPWPELPSQADGPAAFQSTANRTEQMMSNFVSRNDWNLDTNINIPKGSQVNVFSQDVAATAIGWAWIDVNIAIAVIGPEGGRFPATVVANTGGQVLIQQNTTTLRTLRWHSQHRSEFFTCGGGVAVALPLATSLVQVRVVVAVDSSSSSDGWAYEYSVGLTQFGAPRGV